MITGSTGTTDPLALLAAAASSEETRANLESLHKAREETNNAIETNRNLLRQQGEDRQKAEEHLKSLSDAIDQKAREHQTKVETDLATISSRQQKVNADMSAAQDARSKADEHLKSAQDTEDKAKQRLSDLDGREKAVSQRESDVSVREDAVTQREAEYVRKSDQLKAFLS